VNDSRVIKSAEALVDVGHRVTVLCRQFGELPEREERNGVQYHRVEPVPRDWVHLKGRIRAALMGRNSSVRFHNPPESAHQNSRSTANPVTVAESDRANTNSASTEQGRHAATIAVTDPTDTRQQKDESIAAVGRAENASERQAEAIARRAGRKLPDPVKQAVKPLLRRAKRTARVEKRVTRRLAGSVKRAAKRFAGIAKRTIKRATRSVRRGGKRILIVVYWFSEADEFGTAARHHIAELALDAIHAHDLTTLPAGGQAAARAGAWLVYDSHELEMHRNSRYPWFVRLRRRMLERKYIRRADAVVTVSESIADHLRTDYRIPRPTVVMNAPLFDANVIPATTVRQDLSLGADDKLCVYVGNVTVNRGLEHVVRALALLPELHFATVGPRRPATEAELLELAVDLGVRDRLHLIDPVAPNEVVGYIATADASVLPIQNVCLSYYYCMPNKLLESVFAGVPVAVANLLEMRRFVEANRCGVIMDEADPKAIAQAIEQVITGRAQYVLSREDRATLAEQYGWPTQAGHLQSLYSAFSATMDRIALSNRSG
jgi:glycosyltransferase involved in cell wall biosynthesis